MSIKVGDLARKLRMAKGQIQWMVDSYNHQQETIGDILGCKTDDPNRRSILPVTLAREVVQLRRKLQGAEGKIKRLQTIIIKGLQL